MIQEENRNMQICAHIQIRSGTYSCQFSNHPSLLERELDKSLFIDTQYFRMWHKVDLLN